MRVFRVLVVLSAVMFSTGCAKYYWTRAHTVDEQFHWDSYDCAKESSPGPGTAVKERRGLNQQLYKACLNARGYQRDKYAFPPTPSWRGASDL